MLTWILILGTPAYAAPDTGSAEWWDYDWHYRIPVKVTNPDIILTSQNSTKLSSIILFVNDTEIMVGPLNVRSGADALDNSVNHGISIDGKYSVDSAYLISTYLNGSNWSMTLDGSYLGTLPAHPSLSSGVYTLDSGAFDDRTSAKIFYIPPVTSNGNLSDIIYISETAAELHRDLMYHSFVPRQSVQDSPGKLSIWYTNCSGWRISSLGKIIGTIPAPNSASKAVFSVPGSILADSEILTLNYDGSGSSDECYIDRAVLEYYTNVQRTDQPVEITVDFDSELMRLGSRGTFDANSVRVVEYDSSGSIIGQTSGSIMEDGGVGWIMEGATTPNVVRNYFVYFDIIENGAKPELDVSPAYHELYNSFDRISSRNAYNDVIVQSGGLTLLKKTDKVVQDVDSFELGTTLETDVSDYGISLASSLPRSGDSAKTSDVVSYAGEVVYDCSVLPENADPPWTRNGGIKSGAEILSGSKLRIHSDSNHWNQYLFYSKFWDVKNSDGVTVEMSVKVNSCKLDEFVRGRSNYFGFSDGSKLLELQLDVDEVTEITSGLSYIMDTTDKLHTYKIMMKGSDFYVYADGKPIIDGTGRLASTTTKRAISFGQKNGYENEFRRVSGMGDMELGYIKYKPNAPFSSSSGQTGVNYTNVGNYVSSVLDASGVVSWDTIEWNGSAPVGTKLLFQTRSSRDGSDWSEWSDLYESSSSVVSSPDGRYLQYRAVLLSNSIFDTPVFNWVKVHYVKYRNSGSFVSEPVSFDGKLSSVTPDWNATMPPGTVLQVSVSNDEGKTWEPVKNGAVHQFMDSDGKLAGETFRYKVDMRSYSPVTPVLANIRFNINAAAGLPINLGRSESRPSIIGTVPGDGVSGVDSHASMSLVFSESMDHSEDIIPDAVTIVPSARVLGYSWSDDYTNLTLNVERLAYDTIYTVVGGNGMRSAAGGYVDNPYTWSFTIREARFTEMLIDSWFILAAAAAIAAALVYLRRGRKKVIEPGNGEWHGWEKGK